MAACLAVMVAVIVSCLVFPTTGVGASNVYYVSPAGSDSNSGTLGSPWWSISYAVGLAAAGDTIEVMADTSQAYPDYRDNVTVDKTLTIEAYDKNGPRPQVMGAIPGAHVFHVTATNVVIRGLDICGATASGYAAIELYNSQHCVIEGNNCGLPAGFANSSGILISGGSDNTVRGNNCSYNSSYGIRICDSANNTVENNTCGVNKVCGISLESIQGSASNNTLNSNTCANNFGDGIRLLGARDNTIRHNTSSANSSYGIVLQNTASGNTINSNTFRVNEQYNISIAQSSTNKIYLNNFVGGGTGNFSTSGSTNTWTSEARGYVYEGEKREGALLGNYWDSYSGTDANSDGIGDTAYATEGSGDAHPLTKYSLPVAKFETVIGPELSEPLFVRFTDRSSAYDGMPSWKWAFGDSQESADQSPSHLYKNDGTYTVTLTVTDADGDTATTSSVTPITVRDTGPVAGFSASPPSGDAPLKVDFAGTNTRSNDGIVAWQWDFGDGETSDLENPSHTYAKKGKYTVSLKVSEADGNTDTKSSQDLIVVGPQPKSTSDSNPASPSESGQSEQGKLESSQSEAGGTSPAETKSQSLVESLGWLWVVMGVSCVMAVIIIVDRRRRRKNEFDTLL